MTRRILLAVIALCPMSASAAVFQYNYQGSAFANIADPLPPGVSALSASFTVTDMLDTNGSTDPVVPLSWWISDGATTISSATTGYSLINLTIGTANGSIIDWAFDVRKDNVTGISLTRLFTTSDFTGSEFDFAQYCVVNGPSDTCGLLASANLSGTPGDWSVSEVPLPPAIYLFCAALIAGRRILVRPKP